MAVFAYLYNPKFLSKLLFYPDMKQIFKHFILNVAVAILLAPLTLTSCQKPGESTVAVSKVSLSPTTLSLEVGKSGQLTATVSPSDATDKSVSFSSSDAAVATVSADGLVAAVSEGTAIITAKAGGKSATCKVMVARKVIAATAIHLNETEISLEEGEQLQLVATLEPENSDDSIIWSSEDDKIATVSGDGVVSGVGAGAVKISARAGSVSAECLVKVNEPEYRAKERAALVAFYKANNGDGWQYKDNWCTDAPLSNWYGVSMTDDGRHVMSISLKYNNTDGRIPEEIADLTELENLVIENISNSASGPSPMPAAIGKLKKLKNLSLISYSLGGTLPEELFELENLEILNLSYLRSMDPAPIPRGIGKLRKLRELTLADMNLTGELIPEIGNLTALTSLRLFDNNLSGSIPETYGALLNLETVDFSMNSLSGEIPPAFYRVSNFWKLWPRIVWGNSFSQENIRNAKIPKPKSDPIKTLSGKTMVLEDEFAKNQYTVLLSMKPGSDSPEILDGLADLYDNYGDKGLGVITYCSMNFRDAEMVKKQTEQFSKVLSECGAKWESFVWDIYTKEEGPFESTYGMVLYPYGSIDELVVVGPDNTICYSTMIYDHSSPKIKLMDALDYLRGVFNSPVERYDSSDYSADGKVSLLQQATVGKGIDIVITGDLYSDRLIADGSFDKAARQAAEDLFSQEPFKSMRDRFNVYCVNAVSENEEMFNGRSSALGVDFVGATQINGDNAKALEYAQKAVDASRMDDVLVLVLVNSRLSGGTCYMFDAENKDSYAGGASVAWIPYKGISVADGVSSNASTLIHEAAGHGFGKLADEYYYLTNGKISSAAVTLLNDAQAKGWYLNVDDSNDPAKVPWSSFIGDSRYESEQIGLYEGGYTFVSGVWRPSWQSVMNANDLSSSFNAPSRAQIYTRIMKLSEGNSWEFDYEDFVKWDRAHPTPRALRSPEAVRMEAVECFKPIIVNRTWKQAVR